MEKDSEIENKEKYKIEEDVPFAYPENGASNDKNVFSFNKYENGNKQRPYLNMENMQKQKQDKNVFEKKANIISGFTEKHTEEQIQNILQSKLAYNHKCLNQNMPMLTLKQYLFIHFAETFAMNNLISENITLLTQALKKYKESSAIVKLGYSIFHNYCDENFFLVFEGLRTTMKEFYKGYIEELFAHESFDLKRKVLKKKLNGSSKLTQKEVKFIISEMITSQKQLILEKTKSVETYKKLEHLLLSHFVGIFLFICKKKYFLIKENHCTYLENIRIMFESLDKQGKGVISTQKLSELIDMIEKNASLGIKEKNLIEFGDPTFFGHMTFNYYVQALSQCTIKFNGKQLSILKYVNEKSD